MSRRKRKDHAPTEWAEQIRSLREKLGLSQNELARKLDCSAMTVSRWHNAQLAPTARYYLDLGKLTGKSECGFYWSQAGLHSSDVMSVVGARQRKQFSEAADDHVIVA